MAAEGRALASGVRSVAVAGDVTNSVIVTGDDVTIELRVDTDDALLANLLEGSRVPRRTARPVPLDGMPPPSAGHVDRRDEAAAVLAGLAAGRPFDLSGAREVGKTFVVRHALAGPGSLPDGRVYVFAKGKRYADVLQELHEAFFACEPPAVTGEQQVRRDLAPKQATVVLDAVELERDELRELAAILPACHLLLVARERALGEGGRLVLRGLATGDALELVEQELGRPLEPAERPAAEAICSLLDGHPFELRQAVAGVRDGERSFVELAQALGSGVPGAVSPAWLGGLLFGSLTADETAIVGQLAALRGVTVGAEHLAAMAGAADLMPALRALEERRVIASASPRFRITGALQDQLKPGPDDVARATAYFARWARTQRARPARLLTEAPALLELIGRAEAEGRDADVIALGRASDAAFAHGRRWETWGAVLDAVLAAAERSRDDSARAWACHQLGTRAYCLGDEALAVASLQEALRLRHELGERAGAEATRYNLDFIDAPPVDGGDGGDGAGPGPAGRRSFALVVALAASVAVLGAAVAIGLGGGGNDPVPVQTTDGPAITDLTPTSPATTTETHTVPTETKTVPTVTTTLPTDTKTTETTETVPTETTIVPTVTTDTVPTVTTTVPTKTTRPPPPIDAPPPVTAPPPPPPAIG